MRLLRQVRCLGKVVLFRVDSTLRDPNAELARLYRAEYGNLTDAILRVFGVAFGGALLFASTGWAASYYWGTSFAAAHILQWSFMRMRRNNASEVDATIGGVLFILVHASFIWLPTFLAAQANPALALIGALVLGATALYHARRADTALWLVWAQVGVFAASLSFIAYMQLPRIDDPALKAGVILVATLMVAYVALTMSSVRIAHIQIQTSAEKLAHDQKLAAVGRLAGGVAHDFNNMLTVVKGNLELFEHLDSKEERHAVLKEAKTAAERAEGVVRDLLVYARKAPTRPRLADVNDILNEVKSLARAVVPERIDLNVSVNPKPLWTELDDNQLVTALLNLIRNSVDAMPGIGHLTIECSKYFMQSTKSLYNGRTLCPGHYAIITVADTGSGIQPKDFPLIGEPFFTTKEQSKGTGLGVSMVLGFVETLGGGLDFHSDRNGTNAILYLPIVGSYD